MSAVSGSAYQGTHGLSSGSGPRLLKQSRTHLQVDVEEAAHQNHDVHANRRTVERLREEAFLSARIHLKRGGAAEKSCGTGVDDQPEAARRGSSGGGNWRAGAAAEKQPQGPPGPSADTAKLA